MILRRFTKHVTDQNWFAVGLDVIVVVVGIFLGMQVTEWSEQRKQHQEEIQYLQRLHTDLAKQIMENTNRNHYIKQVTENNMLIIEWLEHRMAEDVDSERLVSALFVSSILYPYELYSVTFDELVNTGNIRLIQDINLRQAVAEFYSSTRANLSFWDIPRNNAYRKVVRTLIPTWLQDEIYRYCSLQENEQFIIRDNCRMKIDPELSRSILERTKNIPDIKDLASYNLSVLTDGLGLDPGNIALARAVEQQISETLSGRVQIHNGIDKLTVTDR